jgi:hypothetical protein
MADREATEYAKYGATPPTVGDHRKVNGQIKVLHDTVVAVATDAVDDKLFAFKIPSNAIILPSSTVYHEGLGTSVTLNLGDATTTDGLASLVSVASAGSFSAFENVAVDDYGKEAWELLGHSEDPQGLLDVFFTIKGAAVGSTASIVHEIFYV